MNQDSDVVITSTTCLIAGIYLNYETDIRTLMDSIMDNYNCWP